MKDWFARIKRDAEIAALQAALKPPNTPEERWIQIALLRKIISLLVAEDQAIQRAMYRCSLAQVLTVPPEGASPADVEEAQACYTAALIVFEQVGEAVEVANTLVNLGRLSLIGASFSEEHVRLARTRLLKAESLIARETTPLRWALLQMMIADAELLLVNYEDPQAEGRALLRFERAREPLEQHGGLTEVAGLYNNLGKLYIMRGTGDLGEQYELGLQLFRRAVGLFTQAKEPIYVAATQINLCIAYFGRLRGPEALNLTQAIRYGLAARLLLSRLGSLRLLGLALLNLGHCYIQRDRPGDAARARRCLEQALVHVTHEEHPETWASAHNALAILLANAPPDDAAAPGDALRHFGATLTVFTPDAYPERWAVTNRSIVELALRQQSDNPAAIDPSLVDTLAVALHRLSPEHTPGQFVETATLLGRLYYADGRLAEARLALEQGHAAAASQRAAAILLPSRAKLAASHSQLYRLLVAVCLQLGDVEAALHYTEAGKWRSFFDTLADTRTPVAANPGDQATAQVFQELQTTWQEIDRLTDGLLNLRPQLGSAPREQTIQRLRFLYRRASALDEQLMYNHQALRATGATATLDVRSASALAERLCAHLVEYYEHAEGWGAFVVSPVGVVYARLPVDCSAILADAAMPDRWELTEPRFGSQDVAPGYEEHESPALLRQLYAAFVEPIATALPSSGRLHIALDGLLHRIPLAALEDPVGGGQLIDRYTLSFASSLTELALIEAREATRIPRSACNSLLSVAYPGQLGNPYYLPFVLEEAEAICAIMEEMRLHERKVTATRLHEHGATAAAFLAQAPRHEILHCGCHGRFAALSAEHSGLLLAGGWLTIQQLLLQLSLAETRLCTLGACLGAHSAPGRDDTLVGLHQALLRCGTTAVVASPWKVGDAASAAFFRQFYSRLAAGANAPEALREASLLLRSDVTFAHPRHWAAFQLYGLGVEITL